mgnify:CR=1 FL=1
MPWLQFGFVGLLEIDQVLVLWDRVIGYEDPILLAVFAVAVFMTRSETILATTNATEAVSIYNCSTLPYPTLSLSLPLSLSLLCFYFAHLVFSLCFLLLTHPPTTYTHSHLFLLSFFLLPLLTATILHCRCKCSWKEVDCV